MIEVAPFYKKMTDEGINFFTGVPDSLLKNFCAYLTDHSENHVIAANEGNAVALAAGYYLGTGKPALVYMQNSGIGNAVNPLLSLADPDVYAIPMVLMIGWRGEPGFKDEPQHVKQGAVTEGLLEIMQIPHIVLGQDSADWQETLSLLIRRSTEESRPVAVVIKKNVFGPYQLLHDEKTFFEMEREAALNVILDELDGYSIVSTTGKTSRELFEGRVNRKEGHEKDFLTVGSMGHSSQIALGLALADRKKKICCVDGDGALLMQMGGLGLVAQTEGITLIHILINNGAHESVGGQPTIGFSVDFPGAAKALGYDRTCSVAGKADLVKELRDARDGNGKIFIEVKVNKGSRSDLGRPTTTPQQNRDAFMAFFKEGK